MRKHSIARFATSTLLTGSARGILLDPASAAPPVETEPTLKTSDFRGLPPLTRRGYRIDPTVPVSGYYGQFTVKTDLGTSTAEGIELLRQRVKEVKAAAAAPEDVDLGRVRQRARQIDRAERGGGRQGRRRIRSIP